MKKHINLIILIYILLLPAFLYSSDKAEAGAHSGREIKTIVFLPFNDYTGSSYKYIPSYLSELLKKNFRTGSERLALDWDDIKKLPATSGVTAEQFQDREKTVEFLKSIKADMAVTGRFLIQGNTILIESGVVSAHDGKYEEYQPFETVITDKFLTTLSNYTVTYNEWLRTAVLKESITGIIGKDRGFFSQKIQEISGTGFGRLLSNRWIQFILILLASYILSRVMNFLSGKIFSRFASKTATTVDDEILALSRKPVSAIMILFGMKIAFFSLNMAGNAIFIINNIITGLIILCFTHIVSGSAGIIINSWGSNLTKKLGSRVDNEIAPLFNKIARILIYSVGIIMVLSRFNIDIAPLIASLGIAGFAIGFAVKDSLSNVIGGIMLILDHSFNVGDKVTIDNDTGIIKEVGLRNTKLLTYDNELIIIPNGELVNKKFKNFVLPDPKIRVTVNFSVAYGSDVDFVHDVVLEAIRKIDGISEDPEPVVEFHEMAESSLNFMAKFWIPVYADQLTKKIEATKLIYNTLNDNRINIPFPTHTVYIEKNG
jgi:MscS family membrane protein